MIAYQNGAPVYLRDVAKASQAPQDVERGAWYNHTPAIVLNVQRQPGANVIATVNQIVKQLPALESTLPAGMQVTVVSDSTGVIRASVSDAAFELVLAVVLVVLVIFVVPAQRAGDPHSEHLGAGVAGRHARRDVRAQLFDRQPFR